MNRWTYPVQWMQQKIDDHQAYLEKLHAIVDELKKEVIRLEEEKANRAGRRPRIQ